jgi:hypothetical protein
VFIWKNFEERFKIYNWLAEQKHLQEKMFRFFLKELLDLQFSNFLAKIIQNGEFLFVGLSPELLLLKFLMKKNK